MGFLGPVLKVRWLLEAFAGGNTEAFDWASQMTGVLNSVPEDHTDTHV